MNRLFARLRNPLLLCLLGVCALALAPGRAASQGATSLGTDFWCAFMPDWNIPSDNIRFFIGSGTDNKVTVDFYGGSDQPADTRTFTMTANTVYTVLEMQTALAETRVTETPVYKGIHIHSLNPIVAYGFENEVNTSDGFLALPTPSLGTHYFTACYYDDDYGFDPTPQAGEFVIVAPYDNTQVKITTRADTRLDASATNIGHLTGQTWTTTLMRGQTYMVQSTGTHIGDQDITGSEITSSKPVAVLSGHQRCSIPIGGPDGSGQPVNSKDMLTEMLPSVDRWGTQYYDMPMAYRTVCGDYIRLITADSGCIIYENGAQVGILNTPGDWVDRNQVLDPTVYSSNGKRFLCVQYSYSQNYLGDPGPADPFEIVMTSQEQFQKHMIFRTPNNLDGKPDFDHYATFICADSAIRNLTINGKKLTGMGASFRQFPNTHPVMAAARIHLSSSPKTYIADCVSPFGAYLYGFTSVDGYGWPAGMALKVISPDTLPPLELRDSACGTFHVELYETRHKVPVGNYSFEDTRIGDIALITDTGDTRWPIASYNYAFAIDPSHPFTSGDSTAFYTLTPIDPTKDGYAAVWTVDKAGNDTVYKYYYYAPKLAATPKAPYLFRPVQVSLDSCSRIVLRNMQPKGDIHLNDATIKGIAKGGTFDVTPSKLNITLHPLDSIVLTVCFHPTDTIPSLDSLIVSTDCVPFPYELKGLGVTPIIIAEDIDFGAVVTGDTVCKPLRLRNVGNAPLVIDKNWVLHNMTTFTFSDQQTLPITILPGKFVYVNFCFHPTVTGPDSTTQDWGTNLLTPFLHHNKDTSKLVGVGVKPGLTWDRLTQGYSVECADTNTVPVVLENPPGPNVSAQHVTGVKIIGADASEFAMIGNSLHYTPFETATWDLNPGQLVTVEVRFQPDVSKGYGVRHAKIVAYAQNGDTTAISLSGTVRHTVIRITPPTQNLGVLIPGDPLSTTIWVHNDGDTLLSLNSLTPDSLFTLQFAPGAVILPGDSVQVTVTGTVPYGPRSINITGLNSTDVNYPCASKSTVLVAVDGEDLLVDATGFDYGDVYKCQNGTTQVQATSNGTKTAVLESVRIIDSLGTTGASQFTFDDLSQTKAPVGGIAAMKQGDVQKFTVIYTPTGAGAATAKIVYTFYDASKGVYQYVVKDLTGNGLAFANVVSVHKDYDNQVYSATTGDILSVPVKLKQTFDPKAKVYGIKYTLRYKRDAFEYQFVNGDNGLGQFGQTVRMPDPTDTSFELLTFVFSSAQPILSADTIAHVGLEYMVAKDSISNIEVRDVSFLDQSGQPVCYVTSDIIPGTFYGNNNCGDYTLRRFLKGDNPEFWLQKISPNPVGSSTANIDYQVHTAGLPLTIEIYDVLGSKTLEVLRNQSHPAGSYTATFDASRLASGTYTIRVSTPDRVESSQIVIER